MQRAQQEKTTNQYKTSLPLIKSQDTLVNDSIESYQEYLFDSINIKRPDKNFRFELKDIIIPEEVDSTTNQAAYDHPSIFYPYKNSPVKIEPIKRDVPSYEWLSGLFLLCLILIAWIRFEGQRRIYQVYKAAWARHNINQLERDGNLLTERITPALMFIYVISLSTLILNLSRSYEVEIPGAESSFSFFSVIAGVVLILWLIKMTAIKVSGSIFKTWSESNAYLLTNIIYNTATGLAALPLVFAGHYTDNEYIIYIALAVFAIGLVLRFIRSIFVGLSAQSFPVVYLFLYLCTLEILPWLVIYKIFS
jgi:hypothetical protein